MLVRYLFGQRASFLSFAFVVLGAVRADILRFSVWLDLDSLRQRFKPAVVFIFFCYRKSQSNVHARKAQGRLRR